MVRGDFASVPYQEVLQVIGIFQVLYGVADSLHFLSVGFNSFKPLVLNNVKFERSDAAGECVEATLTATIINTSKISLTNVDLTLVVYDDSEDLPSKVVLFSLSMYFSSLTFAVFQIGHAELKVRRN